MPERSLEQCFQVFLRCIMTRQLLSFVAFAAAISISTPGAAVDDFDAAWMARELALDRAQMRAAAQAHPWPQSFEIDGVSFVLFQPQPDSVRDGQVKGRAVMAVTTGVQAVEQGEPIEARDYGVVWLRARTDVDAQTGAIMLKDFIAERADFPTAKSREETYRRLAGTAIADTSLAYRPGK
jgi:hypothetical protein